MSSREQHDSTAATALREADRIAADFAEIPFEGHEARKLDDLRQELERRG